jgi:hypothetical protein
LRLTAPLSASRRDVKIGGANILRPLIYADAKIGLIGWCFGRPTLVRKKSRSHKREGLRAFQSSFPSLTSAPTLVAGYKDI